MSKFAFAIAAVATVASASAALAGNAFTFEAQTAPAESILELGVVNAPADGVIEIYDYRLGEQGKLLATEAVHAGANDNTRINLNAAPFGDVIAVLSTNGQVVESQRIDIDAN